MCMMAETSYAVTEAGQHIAELSYNHDDRIACSRTAESTCILCIFVDCIVYVCRTENTGILYILYI